MVVRSKLPNGCCEYKAASQNFTANGRYVESRQNHGSQKWLLIALVIQVALVKVWHRLTELVIVVERSSVPNPIKDKLHRNRLDFGLPDQHIDLRHRLAHVSHLQ